MAVCYRAYGNVSKTADKLNETHDIPHNARRSLVDTTKVHMLRNDRFVRLFHCRAYDPQAYTPLNTSTNTQGFSLLLVIIVIFIYKMCFQRFISINPTFSSLPSKHDEETTFEHVENIEVPLEEDNVTQK